MPHFNASSRARRIGNAGSEGLLRVPFRSHRILPISRLSTFPCLKRGQAGKQRANVALFPSETYQREQKRRFLLLQHASDLVAVVRLVHVISDLEVFQGMHFALPNRVVGWCPWYEKNRQTVVHADSAEASWLLHPETPLEERLLE